jgi:protein-S-isoprenylcysteine O-methyltransferase Ste14
MAAGAGRAGLGSSAGPSAAPPPPPPQARATRATSQGAASLKNFTSHQGIRGLEAEPLVRGGRAIACDLTPVTTLPPSVTMNPASWAAVALVYHLASRLLYVIAIGVALKRQEETGYFTRRYGVERGFRRFRNAAAAIMFNDGLSFIALCLVSAHTLPVGLPRSVAIPVGVLLIIVGVATKLWAGATLGNKAYYWHNFFASGGRVVPSSMGPYRYLKNPMYTVGYLPTYGLAILTGSLHGLVAALFDQVAILAFYRWVEKPHFERYSGGTS